MLKFFDKNISISTLSIAIILLTVFLALISVNLASEFNGAGDVFHQGELLGNYWHMLGYYNGREAFPILIHGAMDYWPSLLAGHFFGDDKIIYGTRLVVVVATFISWVVFVFTGIKILSNASNNNPLNLVFVAIFCLTLPLLNLNVMAIEESPVGLRDLFILLQICFLTYFYISKNKAIYFLSLVFLILPFSIVWSYDRGIAATIACLSLIVYLTINKQYLELLASILSFVVSIIIFELTRMAGSLSENIANILYWGKNSSEVWGTAFNFGLQGAISLLPLVFIVLVFCMIYIAYKNKECIIPMGFILFILFVELLLVKSAYNRPNIHRGLMSAWPAVFLFLWIASSKIVVSWEAKNINKFANALNNNLLKVSFFSLVISVIFFSIPLEKVSSFKKLLIAPPSDSKIAGGNLVDIAEALKGDNCSLNMVNQGVITLLSKTSHCTKFPYLIYASNLSQIELIQKINKADIKTIIIDSHDWSSNIDNRSMKSRLPDLHSFLMSSYKNKVSIGNYLILRK